MKFRLILSFLLLMSFLGLARAESSDLYSAEVEAVGEAAAQRNQALSAALSEVMVRLSGSTSVSSRPAASKIVAQASNLVEQYRYRVEEADPAVDEAGELLPPKHFLWAKFDKISLNRLLRQADIPVWSNQRPRVLIWLGLEKGGSREVLNLETDPIDRKALSLQAQKRGMPLQFPLMDLEDQSKLGAADLWADYEAAIRGASARYPHDVILTGRLRSQGNDHWQAQWTLLGKTEIESFSQTGLSWLAALRAGINGAQDRLAAKYAPASGGDGPEKLTVRFTQIASRASYGQLMSILAKQDNITRSRLREVQGDSLLMDLWVRGGSNALARGLALGGELFQEESSDALGSAVSAVPTPSNGDAFKVKKTPADMTFSLLH